MSEEQIKEAAGTVQQSVGVSSYLHGINYSVDRFKQELEASMRHAKSRSKVKAGV